VQFDAALPEHREAIQKMARALAPHFSNSVTPIGMSWGNGSSVQQHATGTFFQVGERYFLVSAAHAFYANGRLIGDLTVCNPVKAPDGRMRLEHVGINGELHRTSTLPGSEDADLAVVELDHEVVSRLSGRRFLRLHEVQLCPTYPGWYFVYGFPKCQAGSRLGTPDYMLNGLVLAAPICRPPANLEKFCADLHFVLNADRKSLVEMTTGEPATLPRYLNGISGCSIWQTLRPGQRRFDGWDPNSIRVAGVEISYYPDRSLIKCAHWGIVADILHRRYSDLRPIIDMYLDPEANRQPHIPVHRR